MAAILQHPQMDVAPANPLYAQWLAVADSRASDVAVRDVASGREWSFSALQALAAQAAPSPPILHTTARGLQLIIDVLRVWRDGTVLLADDGSAVAPPDGSFILAGVCHLKATSGSTGRPRHVQFRPTQLAADASQIMATMGLRADWPNVGVISMAHSYGFSNLVLPLLLHGVPLWMLENPLPETMRRLFQCAPPLTLAAVPAMWQAWHRVGVDFGPVRLAISAGAPLPIALEAAVFERNGLKIHNFYGSSECGGIAYDRSMVPRKQASLAGTPMIGVVLECDAASGCLRITSPAVADGYVMADARDRADTDPGDGRWLTSDLVRFDEDGGVHLLGRISDSVSVAGHKISPTVIEEVIMKQAGVRHCVVFGVPSSNSIRVEDLVACVNLEPGTDMAALKNAFLSWPHTYCPRHWWSCDDLQPDFRGKISRHHWRQQWMARD